MANIPGWKDILRPIRDGIHHIFPSPVTGPTPEERAKQRESDRLKGFTYFDTFLELEHWSEAESDAIQRANTPLLKRSQRKSPEGKNVNVLLCHDYSGNYQEYENVRSIGVERENYTCEHLQFVDTFVYFSHKLVCVPPPSWTNTLHRNGVKVYGTVLIEPQTEGSERLLTQSKKDGARFPLAVKLAAIMRHYGFDGWLINIEKPFPRQYWDLHALESFLQQLRDDLSEGSLIWYDAITDKNKIDYQNALTKRNVQFANKCERILTNYSWKETDAWDSQRLGHQMGLRSPDIFFGVDVWAQNTSKLTHPRITYPEKGGGGTNTGIAVDKLAEIGLSVGIFAPAWTFEHFPGHGRAMERAVWDGQELPPDLDCSCGRAVLRHPQNREYPITKSATQFPAGSEHFFFTDFNRGFARHESRERDILYGGTGLHSQIGAQSILPHNAAADGIESSVHLLSFSLEQLPGRTQLVVEAQNLTSGQERTINQLYEEFLPLFRVDMASDGTLQFRAEAWCKAPDLDGVIINFYLKSTWGTSFIDIQKSKGFQRIEKPMKDEGSREDQNRLREIGIYIRGRYSPFIKAIKLVEVAEICISRSANDEHRGRCDIKEIKIERRERNAFSHWRLCWTFFCDSNAEIIAHSMGMPYSGLTGPFAYFSILIDDLSVGRCYASEHVLDQKLLNRFSGHGADVSIIGVGFDGRELARRTDRLCI